MTEAADYLAEIKARIVGNARILHWGMLREEAQGDTGLYRCRLTLTDGGVVEMFEYFRIKAATEVEVTAYSFHWQDESGRLLKRWDNAPHHPEVSTFPHHLHDGAEECLKPHEAMNAGRLLALLTSKSESTEKGSNP